MIGEKRSPLPKIGSRRYILSRLFCFDCKSAALAVHSIAMSSGEFFVDHPILHHFVATTETILKEQREVTDRLSHLRRPYDELLNNPSWLPDQFRQPNPNSAMGGGIASWLLYRSEAKDLSLFSLVVPVGSATPDSMFRRITTIIIRSPGKFRSNSVPGGY